MKIIWDDLEAVEARIKAIEDISKQFGLIISQQQELVDLYEKRNLLRGGR